MKNSASEDELRTTVERNESRAHLSTFFIIIGLVVEIVLAAFSVETPTIKHWAPVAADVLIVLGVAGEILFSRKAARSQKALQVHVDARVADALNRAAAAQEELRKFRTPRVQLLTAENRERLLAALSPFGGTIFVVGHDEKDREVWEFLWEFEPLIRQAGWIHVDWQGGRTFPKRNWPEGHLYGFASVMNISIETRLSGTLDVVDPVTKVALAHALREVGIEAVTAAPNNSIQTNVVMLLVGPKR